MRALVGWQLRHLTLVDDRAMWRRGRRSVGRKRGTMFRSPGWLGAGGGSWEHRKRDGTCVGVDWLSGDLGGGLEAGKKLQNVYRNRVDVSERLDTLFEGFQPLRGGGLVHWTQLL